jgi:hypothetical protein
MEKAIRFEKPSEVRTAIGKEVCVTDWITVDQQRIDKFGRGDRRLPVDPCRCRAREDIAVRRHDCARLPDPVAARRVLRTLPTARVSVLRPGLELRAQQDSLHLARAQREPTTRSFRAGQSR